MHKVYSSMHAKTLLKDWSTWIDVQSLLYWIGVVAVTFIYLLPQDSLLDATRNYQHDLHNVKYIASCVPSALMRMSPQLLSLFNLVPFLYPSDDCLQCIFSKSVLLWLQQFPEAAVGDAMPLTEVGSRYSLQQWPCASFIHFGHFLHNFEIESTL